MEPNSKFKKLINHVQKSYPSGAKKRLLDLERLYQRIDRIGSWEWNLKTGEIFWSDGLYSIYELDPDEFEPTVDAFKNYVHPDDLVYIDSQISQIISKSNPVNFSFRIITAKGQNRTVNAVGEITEYDECGKPVVMMGVNHDITEQNQAENAFRESEERYHILVSNVPGTVFQFVLTRQGNFRFEYISENCIDIFSYSASEIREDPKVVFDNIPQPDADKVQQAISQSASTLTPFSFDQRFIKRDGKTIWIHASSIPRKLPNGDIIWDGVGMDITERKKAEERLKELEERFRLTFYTSPDAVNINKMDGTYLEINEGFIQLTGYSREDVIGKTSTDINIWNIPEDRERLVEGLQKDGYVRNLESQFLMKDGSYKIALMSAVIIQLKGEPHILSITRDITDFRKTEQDKLILERQLQQAQKMEAIGTLAGGIAHDFNNILGAILGYAEMVQDECPPGSIMRSDIDRVVESSHRAKELVKQILAFSRQAESDKIVLQPALIIKEAMKMLRASLPKTIDIQQNIDPEAGLILADPTQIHQIITNLCTNAFHAMEEIGGTLKVSLKNKELTPDNLAGEPNVKPGKFVEIAVGDTGPGIAPEIMDKIFDPFFTTKEIGKGTGMGLAIIHGIAKKSGGFVSCKSSQGVGTTFHVYFPVHAVTAQPDAKTAPLELIQTGIERILFVDDEEMLAEMGKAMLERLGYRVTVETNSIEALKTIQSRPNSFDLVITDQTMPGMTGTDLARRILQIRPELPIILCTGFSNQISEEKARIYGIQGFAMKPLAKKDLATLIRKVLNGEK